MGRATAFALIVVAATSAAAAPEPKPPAKAASVQPTKSAQRIAAPISFDRLGYAEGLPNSNVRRIVQDTLGFMWFGTQDGLARYDGSKMRVYRTSAKEPTSISGTYITVLLVDGDGKLWVGTPEDGVNLYDPETDQFTRFTKGSDGGLSSQGVTAAVRDLDGAVWFAMTGGGLDRFDPVTRKFESHRKDPLDATITTMALDVTGDLWLGTSNEGVIRWNPKTKVATRFGPEPKGTDQPTVPITAVLVAENRVWIGTEGEGLLSLDPKTRAVVRFQHAADDAQSITDDRITALFRDGDQTLWIGTANGLSRMDRGKITQHVHDPNDPLSLAFPGVETIYQDRGGTIWVGGFTVGACKLDKARISFGRYRTRTHPANSYFEERDGSMWVGTYHGGLYKYDWAAQRATLYQTLGTAGGPTIPLESTWIAALHADARGTLWMSLIGQGLVAFDPKTDTFKQYLSKADDQNSLPVDTIWDIWEDPQGMLWFATWGGGLVRFDPKAETFTSFTIEDSNHLYTLYPDPIDANILWLGAAKGGLIRFDRTAGTASSFRNRADDPTSLSSDDVLSIHRDGGTVWVGTYGGGLNKVDLASKRVERYTSREGLPNDILWGVLPDGDGNLWISTNGGGLVQFDPRTKKQQVYEAADGIQSNEFAQGSFMRTRSGKLVFGGVNGFNMFSPRDIKRDAYAPPVVITSLKVFNHEVSLDRPIWTLPPLAVAHSDSFEVQFAALAFSAPTKNRYAYKLDGFDDDFIETDRPYATYTKLDGGKYTLRVRAANRHGVWSEQDLALTIAVTPPFWRTWPAYIIYMILLLGLVALVIYIQRQRLKRAEREGRLAVIERDLALTGAVQNGFLPDTDEIRTSSVQLFGFYRPADACSGDWWWHKQFGARHVILVGDVTGHGPGPAMVTAAVATAFGVLTRDTMTDMRSALQVMNDVVLNVSKGKYHMTMACLELEETTGKWILYSAGAPPIMTLSSSGKHKVHFCPGTPLGTESTFEPGIHEGVVQSGERLFICTDGIPEIALPNGGSLGLRRLGQLYEKTYGRSLRDAATMIVDQANVSQGGRPQDDDWTFTMVEWNAPA
jgi:ligand-binding sensor domain-containing protein